MKTALAWFALMVIFAFSLNVVRLWLGDWAALSGAVAALMAWRVMDE
jgi:hypothetical protein